MIDEKILIKKLENSVETVREFIHMLEIEAEEQAKGQLPW